MCLESQGRKLREDSARTWPPFPRFFPATVYLSTSKVCVAVVANFAFSLSVVLYTLLIALFFGKLREVEIERTKERATNAVMEMCLALTIVKNDFSILLLAMMMLT